VPFEACIARERSTGLLGIDLEKKMQSARFFCKFLTRRHAILASDDPNNFLDDQKSLSMAAEKALFESYRVGLWREQGGNISFGRHQTQFFASHKEKKEHQHALDNQCHFPNQKRNVSKQFVHFDGNRGSFQAGPIDGDQLTTC